MTSTLEDGWMAVKTNYKGLGQLQTTNRQHHEIYLRALERSMSTVRLE